MQNLSSSHYASAQKEAGRDAVHVRFCLQGQLADLAQVLSLAARSRPAVVGSQRSAPGTVGMFTFLGSGAGGVLGAKGLLTFGAVGSAAVASPALVLGVGGAAVGAGYHLFRGPSGNPGTLLRSRD